MNAIQIGTLVDTILARIAPTCGDGCSHADCGSVRVAAVGAGKRKAESLGAMGKGRAFADLFGQATSRADPAHIARAVEHAEDGVEAVDSPHANREHALAPDRHAALPDQLRSSQLYGVMPCRIVWGTTRSTIERMRPGSFAVGAVEGEICLLLRSSRMPRRSLSRTASSASALNLDWIRSVGTFPCWSSARLWPKPRNSCASMTHEARSSLSRRSAVMRHAQRGPPKAPLAQMQSTGRQSGQRCFRAASQSCDTGGLRGDEAEPVGRVRSSWHRSDLCQRLRAALVVRVA